jgi:hypothetical protein
MSFKDIILPLDCSGIDLEFVLSAGTVAELDDANFRHKVMIIPDADNRLKTARDPNNTLKFIAQSPTVLSNITIKGEEYRVIGHAGNGGYGSTCIVAKDNPDGTESRFVLKEQTSINDAEDLRVIKEAIINLCLNEATGVGMQPFFPKIHSVFFSKRNGALRLYCLIDLLAVDGVKLISTPQDNVIRGTLILTLFKQLIDRLKELYDKFAYNHGDLKPGNVMIDHNNNLRLIDFGMSRIVLEDSGQPVTLQLSEFNQNSTESNDLTLMAALINNQAKGFIAGPCEAFIDTIDNGFNCKTNTWIPTPALLSDAIRNRNKKSLKCGGVNVRNMEELYRYNDTYINPAGTFDVVKASYPDWDSLPALDLSAYGFVPRRLIGPQGPRPIVAVLPLVVSMPGGAKLRRKTKSKRVYRKHAKSRRRKSKHV